MEAKETVLKSSLIPSQYRKEELWQAKVKEWLGENK
jgi:hypothetical protein